MFAKCFCKAPLLNFSSVFFKEKVNFLTHSEALGSGASPHSFLGSREGFLALHWALGGWLQSWAAWPSTWPAHGLAYPWKPGKAPWSSLDAGHTPWSPGQLGKAGLGWAWPHGLGLAGEGCWALGRPPGPPWAVWNSPDPWDPWLIPESADHVLVYILMILNIFSLLNILSIFHSFHIVQFYDFWSHIGRQNLSQCILTLVNSTECRGSLCAGFEGRRIITELIFHYLNCLLKFHSNHFTSIQMSFRIHIKFTII